MKLLLLACLFCFLGLAADRGLPARAQPSDYPLQVTKNGITLAADLMSADAVRGSFATDLDGYAVIEVAVYPRRDGPPLDLSTVDFALRFEGRSVRPVEPRSIARINQKRAQPRSRDVTFYPNVGVHTGSWGTGTTTGVGVGIGPGSPGPASSDRDREVMEQELDDRALQDTAVTRPVAGYLYFPVGDSRRKARSYVLELQTGGADLKLTLPVPKTK